MVNAATQFLADIFSRQVRPYWISFLGPSGTGKSLLAKMLFQFIKQHALLFSPGYGIHLTDQCYCARWPRIAHEMKNGDSSTIDLLIEMEEKWDRSRGLTVGYALIDDIGQIEDSSKSYLIGALGRIADLRMNSWTIWTANLHLEQLGEALDRRITSRMVRDGNIVIENHCIDFNLR